MSTQSECACARRKSSSGGEMCGKGGVVAGTREKIAQPEQLQDKKISTGLNS